HECVDDCCRNLIIVFVQRLRAQPRRVAQTIEADVLRADTEGSTRTNVSIATSILRRRYAFHSVCIQGTPQAVLGADCVRVSFESMDQLLSSCDFLRRIDLVEIASCHAVAHGVRTRASDISGVLRSHVCTATCRDLMTFARSDAVWLEFPVTLRTQE
ncbi:hypothetical protein HYDPIDRAFT_119492, partial [Hydnomerulius pinastri MD-312]